MRFVDTNVLLYAVSRAAPEQAKATIARTLLSSRDLVVSTQVLGEFYLQTTRVTRPDSLSHQDAVDLVRSFGRFTVQSVTWDVVVAAMGTRDRFGISYWDAAVLEAARTAGCSEVLSEDLSDAQDYHGVRVRNPFR